MSNMSIEEAQRILQEAGWETIPPKATGVVTEPNEEDVYWFCYSDKLALESYTESNIDQTMLRHRRIFHDEASAQKRLQEDEYYIEVDRRQIYPDIEAVRDDVADVINGNSPIEDLPVKSINMLLSRVLEILSPPLPQAEGPK